MNHKCFEDLKNNNTIDYSKSIAELSNYKTKVKSGYGIRVIVKTITGTRKKSFLKLAYCPFCGQRLLEEQND